MSRKAVVGENRDALAVILDRDRPADSQISPLAPVVPDARASRINSHERHPAAIENRHFEVVDLDDTRCRSPCCRTR